MTISYTLEKDDLLNFYLYHFSRNVNRLIWVWRIIGVLLFLGAMFILLAGEVPKGLAYIGLAAIVGLATPIIIKWLIARKYLSDIGNSFEKLLGGPLEMTFEKEKIKYVLSKTKGSFDADKVEKIVRLPDHLLIKLNNNSGYMIPESQVNSLKELEEHLKYLGFTIASEPSWRW